MGSNPTSVEESAAAEQQDHEDDDEQSGRVHFLSPVFGEGGPASLRPLNARESLYRMVAVLTGMGITMMMTAELEDSYMDLRFSPHGTAFLTDAIIMQVYRIEGSAAAHHGRRESARQRSQ